MTIKAIFAECSNNTWLDVVERLAKKYNWEPCYWIGSPNFEKPLKRCFPNAVFHSNLDAVRGKPAPDCISLKLPALDQPTLERLSFYQSIALRMMNRMDRNNSFSFEEREHLFHKYVKYWTAVLDNFKPDVVVLSISPHLIYDYVLYKLSHLKGFKTVMFDYTTVRGGWIYPMESFEEGSSALLKKYNSLLRSGDKDVKLSPDAETYLKEISAKAHPFYFEDSLKKKNPVFYAIRLSFDNQIEFHSKLQKFKDLFSRSHYIKECGKRIENSDLRGWKYIFCKIEGKKKKDMLKSHYMKLQQNPDYNKPYVYVALHYQPENSTSPLGETFADQYLMIDLLSKNVPEGWKIYVRENPIQWDLIGSHGECSRSIDFYDDIVSLPNTALVPIDPRISFDLIIHSKAVATVTGSVGFEAVCSGVPSLIFGHAWYRFCKGVFYTPSEEKLKDALSLIKKGYKVEKRWCRLFLKALSEVRTIGYIDEYYAKDAFRSMDENVTPEKNVISVSDTIHKFITENK